MQVEQLISLSTIEQWKFPKLAINSVLGKLRISLSTSSIHGDARVITSIRRLGEVVQFTMEDDLGQYDHLREGSVE